MSRMHWHPVTGECRTFADDENEPDGWLDTHPLNPNLTGSESDEGGSGQKTVEAERPMNRSEVVAALKAGEIAFDNKATAVALQQLLRDELLVALRARDVQGIDTMTTRELLIAVEQ